MRGRWILASVGKGHKIYQKNLIKPVLISCLLPGSYVRLCGGLSCIWWLRPEYPPTSLGLCCSWRAESFSEDWGGCGVAGGIPESSGSLEFLGEDRDSLAGRSSVSFARVLASWEAVFFAYFVKKCIRLLHFRRVENCSAGPKIRLENAGRQFLCDCWRGHDKGCY